MTKTILNLGDLHVGSMYGLMPPSFTDSAGAEIRLNPGQRYLWECWEHMLEMVKEEIKPDYIVLMGDTVDGRQQAQRGTELNLVQIRDQTSAAHLALAPVKAAAPQAKLFAILGTEYHVGRAGEDEEVLAEKLGCQQYAGLGTGRYLKRTLDLEPEGCGGVTINFHHEMPVATGVYRGTGVAREALWAALTAKEGDTPRADCIVRGHVHNFFHVEDATRHAFTNPCWQLQTYFMGRKSPYRMIPHIGFTWLTIDGDAKKRGADPVTVHKKIYKLPKSHSVKA